MDMKQKSNFETMTAHWIMTGKKTVSSKSLGSQSWLYRPI